MSRALASLDPLPRLLTAVAVRRAADPVLRALSPLSVVACGAALLLARYRPHTPRALALLGAALALAPLLRVPHARRTRALALAQEVDRRLGARDAVTTAAELCLRDLPRDEGAGARVMRDARAALVGARRRDVLAPLERRHALALIVASAALLAGAFAPVPPRPMPRARPAAVLRSSEVAAAARAVAESLQSAAVQEPPRADALRDLAARADALGRDLAAGTLRDEALARMDAIEQQAESALGWARDPAQQRAMDAALAELAAEPALRDALAQGDLGALDAAARRSADRREARDRGRAAEALERAAEAARRSGSDALARALRDEASLLRRRGTATELAREIAAALGDTPGARRIAEHLARGDDDAELSRALDEALRELDRTLSPEARQRLARSLARMAEGADDVSRADLDRAARAMSPEEMRAAMRALVEALRSGSLDRTRMGAAARAGADARERIARLRAGMQSGSVRAAGGEGTGSRGTGNDPGHIPTAGETRAVQGGGFVAPTQGNADPSVPGVTVATERVDITGAQATTVSEGAVRAAAPGAIHGVERVAMPPAWRAQVRTYFSP